MLAGVAIDEGLMELDAQAPIARWQHTEKEGITTKNLLNMADGLLVNEDYSKFSDVTRMLYMESDQFDYALRQKVVYAPREQFQYSIAEANRVAATVQQAVGRTQQATCDFYENKLFYPLAITSAFIEYDASGKIDGAATRRGNCFLARITTPQHRQNH